MSNSASAAGMEHLRALVASHNSAAGEHEPRFEFVALEGDGIVQLRIPGVGGCCPASALPWVENLESQLKRDVPGVRLVEIVP